MYMIQCPDLRLPPPHDTEDMDPGKDFLPEMIKQTRTSWSKSIYISLAGLLLPVFAPYIQLSVIYGYWTPYKMVVDKGSCTCTCWDTQFKGTYQEELPGYKNVYFNTTRNTFIIWILTLGAVISTYESTKYIIRLHLSGNLRTSMLILLIGSIYPHYYSWWAYFNAFNDEYYSQFIHQGIYSFTEMASTLVIIYLCDRRSIVKPVLLLVIIDVACLHVLGNFTDQFMSNVVHGEGEWHQVMRDVSFMLCDLLNVCISLVEMRNYSKNHGLLFSQCLSYDELVCSIVLIALLWLICAII